MTKIGVKFNTNFCYFRTIVEITPAFIKYHYSGMVSKLRIDSVFVYWYIQFFIVNLFQFIFLNCKCECCWVIFKIWCCIRYANFLNVWLIRLKSMSSHGWCSNAQLDPHAPVRYPPFSRAVPYAGSQVLKKKKKRCSL